MIDFKAAILSYSVINKAAMDIQIHASRYTCVSFSQGYKPKNGDVSL